MKLDIITAPLVNRMADAIANDLNYGTQTVKLVADKIRCDYSESVAMWTMDMAVALTLGD
jgi:hypothetical protein